VNNKPFVKELNDSIAQYRPGVLRVIGDTPNLDPASMKVVYNSSCRDLGSGAYASVSVLQYGAEHCDIILPADSSVKEIDRLLRSDYLEWLNFRP
jgi:hypothetical protein